ncbi:thioredoxin fold domain-containing protein [Thiorhodococcus minor]|nr:thioredoxin fold domain-containing protein [Thiorhodococcus minor]
MCPSHPSSETTWRLLLTVTLNLPLGSVLAEPAPADVQPSDLAGLMQGIGGMRRLPVSGVQMVQSGDQVFFVSANGRYAFLGLGFDLWHGTRLTSLAEADRLMQRIDRSRLKLAGEDLGALDLGTGDGEVLVFVDPRCPQCAALLDRIRALSEVVLKTYRFRLIPLPVLSQASQREVLALNCLAETDQPGAIAALLEHRTDVLSPATGRCGQGPIQRALVTAHLLGIERVPFLIAPDGRLQSGAPADLSAWLAGEEGA